VTATLPDVDTVTLEDLQPPCDVLIHAGGGTWHNCDRPAEWILRTRCKTCGHAGVNLVCDYHRELAALGGRYVCDHCKGSNVAMTAERL
jgi:hypothetical protein